MIFASKPMNHATQSKVKILYREVRGSRFEVRGSRFEVRGSRNLKALRLTLQGFLCLKAIVSLASSLVLSPQPEARRPQPDSIFQTQKSPQR